MNPDDLEFEYAALIARALDVAAGCALFGGSMERSKELLLRALESAPTDGQKGHLLQQVCKCNICSCSRYAVCVP